MMQFALGASAIKEAAGLLTDVVEDPDTYKRIDALRAFVSRVTGIEIDKGAFVALLEETTQGEAYTGKWEECDPNNGQDHTRRMRVRGGWIFDVGRGNPLLVLDK